MFVVEPNDASWERTSWSDRGRPLKDGFSYTSDTNEKWLSQEEIADLIKSIEDVNPGE
jgi:hypothetical protein